MCGIAGLAFGQRPVDPNELRRFTDTLIHRGPDGADIWVDGSTGFGHRRLAILDLSDAGACPMTVTAPDGRTVVITYNGEVFNFLELRQELEGMGYRFRSGTDTEVVAAAWLAWGEQALLRFNGMFAFVLWNVAERSLVLVRDRFGIKPLYYRAGARLAFASELKAFLALDDFRAQLNVPLAQLLMQDASPVEGGTHETLLQGVSSLPAGHLLAIDAAGRGGVRRWWDTQAHVPTVPTGYEEQVEAFRALFLDAVRLRLRADVPVGTCLSGGLDSSAVAGAIAAIHAGQQAGTAAFERTARDWQHAFIASYPGSDLDERRHADQVVAYTGIQPHVMNFAHDAATASVQECIWSGESVHGLVSAPVWHLYAKLRAEGVLVSLDGHGGDGLLGGYSSHLRVPRAQLNQHLHQELHHNMLPNILRNFDRASMAHGIEVRMPLLDWRLVTFAAALPPDRKIGGGFTKRILRDAMAGLAPESIRWRRSKVGFNAPLIEWCNASLNPFLVDVTQLPFFTNSPLWNGAQLGRDLRARIAAGPWVYDDWSELAKVAVVTSLTVFHRQFIEGIREPISAVIATMASAIMMV
jgi:asparagine synthase (glutamine-hydrolysing)